MNLPIYRLEKLTVYKNTCTEELNSCLINKTTSSYIREQTFYTKIPRHRETREGRNVLDQFVTKSRQDTNR